MSVKNISDLLDSLSSKTAKSADGLLNPANPSTVPGGGSGSGNNSFGQVIAKVADQQQTANNNPAPAAQDNPAPVPVVTPTAVTAPGTQNQAPALNSSSSGTTQTTQDTLLVSERLQGVKPQDIATIEKSFFAMASGLASLLSQAQQLAGENSDQLQAQLVANSGGKITPAEASQLVSAVLSFINNLPPGQNPLDLNKQDQNNLVGQMLQQMLQNQQVAFALTPTAIQGDQNGSNNGQGIAGVSGAAGLSNVTLQFLFTEGQINQTKTTGNQGSGLQVNYQAAQVSVTTQTFETQNAQGLRGTGAGAANFALPAEPSLNTAFNFQPIPQDKVQAILNALSQLGAQPASDLNVTVVNPTLTAQGEQASANSKNLQSLFKVLLQAGAGPVMLQSSLAQQAALTNNSNVQNTNVTANAVAQLTQGLTGTLQAGAVQAAAGTQNTANPNVNQNPLPVQTGVPAPVQPVINPVPAPVVNQPQTGQKQQVAQAPLATAPNPDAIQAPQTQAPSTVNIAPKTTGQSFWSSVNFKRINELVLRFTNFIGNSNTTVAVQTPGNQGPAQIAVASSPSAITAQVGTSIGPNAQPISISQLPDGSEKETVNNNVVPNTVQIQPDPIPTSVATTTVRVETQNQTRLAQDLLDNQAATAQVAVQTPVASPVTTVQAQPVSNSQSSSPAQSSVALTPPAPGTNAQGLAAALTANTNPLPIVPAGTPNIVTPTASINPAPPATTPGAPVPPQPQVSLNQPVNPVNVVQPAQSNGTNQGLNPLNQAANPGLSATPISPAQNLSGSVAAVDVFKQGTTQVQPNNNQAPLNSANPVQPTGTVSTATAQAVTTPTNLGAYDNSKPIGVQEKNPLNDLMNSQNQNIPNSTGLVYTLGKGGEVQAVNAAGNTIPINATDLIGQISGQVTARGAELRAVTSISFQLQPENLGRLNIQVSLVDQSVSARILVTNPEVKEALQQHMVDLQTALNQAGLAD